MDYVFRMCWCFCFLGTRFGGKHAVLGFYREGDKFQNIKLKIK